MNNFITPDWDAPNNVHAFMTTRIGGVSDGVYGDVKGFNGLNPATHVGDDAANVLQNRTLIRALVPSEPQWLNQTHSVKVWHGDYDFDAPPPEADAVVIDQVGQVGVVMTADCLPVLLASADGAIIAAAHAGWRGLVDGVLEQTLQVMAEKGARVEGVHVWLGAAIGPEQFEVGHDVLDAFSHQTSDDVRPFFKPKADGKCWADLYGLARQRLIAEGVTRISGGNHCTVSEPERFYSYRRDRITGRMATLIWLD
jgi:YfiH family protein